MFDPLNPPWKATLPPFLKQKTPMPINPITGFPPSYDYPNYPQSLRPMQTPPDAVQPTPETDPYPDLEYSYCHQAWYCKQCGRQRQTKLGVKLGVPLRACVCVLPLPPDPYPDLERQDSLECWSCPRCGNIRQTDQRRKLALEPVPCMCSKSTPEPDLDEVVAQSETVAGPYAGVIPIPLKRKPCGCIAAGACAQHCEQCRPHPALADVVYENSNSALRRKIRAEIIEEVTRFLTGEDD